MIRRHCPTASRLASTTAFIRRQWGTMAARGLYIFKHESKLGNAQAQRLFESIKVEKKPGVESPRAFNDYIVVPPDPNSLPEGITLIDGLA